MPIIFSNPGEIDIRALVTLGVNAKESASAIGYFGTGFKYALAVALRAGCAVQVISGADRYAFGTNKVAIRGKDFGLVQMSRNDEPAITLGFTTDLGKNWTLEHAYREFYSNCLDEGGKGGEENDLLSGHFNSTGHTHIVISGSAFARAHALRADFLLAEGQRRLLEKDDSIEIYAGRSDRVFYRGIAAYTLPQMSAFTYNVTEGLTLTEDRQIVAIWDVQWALQRYVTNEAKDSDIIARIVTGQDFEKSLTNYTNFNPSEAFLDAVSEAVKKSPTKVNDSAMRLYIQHKKIKDQFQPTELRAGQQRQLDEAILFCERIGFPVREVPIKVVASAGEGVHALATEGEIILGLSCFEQHLLREALIEEFIHIRFGVQDFSRKMQNVLFAQIVRLGEQVGPAKAEAAAKLDSLRGKMLSEE